LTTHAFFKALLFLGAGAVIVACHHEQDIRKMGGLRYKIPLVGAVFLVGTLSMGGPLAGMWSKESIMEAVHAAHFNDVWFLLVVTAFLTPFYIGRLFVMVFLGKPYAHDVHPLPRTMTVPLIVLAALSAIPILWSTLLAGWLEPLWPHAEAHGSAGLHLGISCAAMVLGYGAAYFLDLGTFRKTALHRAMEAKFWVDEIYDWTIVRPLKVAAVGLWIVVDRLLIDYLLVHGPARWSQAAGGVARRLHTGSVNVSVIFILAGALAAVGSVLGLMFLE